MERQRLVTSLAALLAALAFLAGAAVHLASHERDVQAESRAPSPSAPSSASEEFKHA